MKKILLVISLIGLTISFSHGQILERKYPDPNSFNIKSTDELIKQIYTERNINTCDGRIPMRSTIARILGERGDAKAIPALIDTLNSPDEEIITGIGCVPKNGLSYVEILRALKKFGPDAKAAIPAILNLLSRDGEDLIIPLVDTLMTIDPTQSTKAIQYVIPLLKSPRIGVVTEAAQALDEMNAINNLPEDLQVIAKRFRSGSEGSKDASFVLLKLEEYEKLLQKRGVFYKDWQLFETISQLGPAASNAVPILNRIVEKYSDSLPDYLNIADALIKIDTPEAQKEIQTVFCHDRVFKFRIYESLKQIGKGCNNISIGLDGQYIVKE